MTLCTGCDLSRPFSIAYYLDYGLKLHRNHLVILYLNFFILSVYILLILECQIKQYNLNYICAKCLICD